VAGLPVAPRRGHFFAWRQETKPQGSERFRPDEHSAAQEIRNPKHEIRNKSKMQNPKQETSKETHTFLTSIVPLTGVLNI
jgi:hypothetical protein